MKKYALHLFLATCFLRAAEPEEQSTEEHHPHPTPLISQLNNPNIDATTLKILWGMGDRNPSLRDPVVTIIKRRIVEPNADPAILQLARDIGKYYGDYPGLREQVAAIVRNRLAEPRINLAILQVALSTVGFDPELYVQAVNIIKYNITGPSTHLGVLKLALDISLFDPALRKDVVTIIDDKIAEAGADPCVLELAWYSRHPKLVEQTKSIVMRKLAESGVDANGSPTHHPIILHLAHIMGIR